MAVAAKKDSENKIFPESSKSMSYRKGRTMKKSIKKLLALTTAVIMVLSLAACGGGSSSGGSSEAPAEPNAGVAGIVFSVPDDWTVDGASVGEYISYKTGDYYFGVSVIDEEDIADFKTYDSGVTAETVEEYFEQNNTGGEDKLKERGVERSETEVCGGKGYAYKGTNKNGVAGLGTNFLYDGNYYMVYFDYEKAYDNDGKLRDDIPALSSELETAYNNVIASMQGGDGDALLSANLNVNSVGSLSFEVPEGYSVASFSDRYVTLKKDGSAATIQISITDEEDLEMIEDENGNHPESVEAEYKNRTEYADDSDKTTIAGVDGYKYLYPYEDDVYYDTSAVFMADGVMYDIGMSTGAWDNDGNIKEGAEQLSQDDLAAFDSFLASLKIN